MAAMTKPAPAPKSAATQGRRVAQILTVLILLLAAVASAGGLFLPGLYRDTAWVVPQNRGADLVTLVLALPALLIALLAARRGSFRATMIWVGLLGYLLYTYIGGTFAFAFNDFYLIYLALFSLTAFALVAAVSFIDPGALAQRFDSAVPRRAVAGFLLLVACMLTLLWLSQIIPFLTREKLPDCVALSGGTTCFVYGLDLGVIVPLCVLAAAWLWRRAPWGYLLAGCMLIKAATMGLALLGMTWFGLRAGLTAQIELTASYVVIAAGGLGMSVWFFRHCRS